VIERGRILVIDDSEVTLARAGAVLTAGGYDVVTTTNPVGNARHLKTSDLVLVDLHMPGLNGVAVLRSLRAALPAGATTPVFSLFTTDERASIDWQTMGFDGVITQKGLDRALIDQVHAVFRTLRLRALASRKTTPSR
jgi:CheY-like chemotaxis protein